MESKQIRFIRKQTIKYFKNQGYKVDEEVKIIYGIRKKDFIITDIVVTKKKEKIRVEIIPNISITKLPKLLNTFNYFTHSIICGPLHESSFSRRIYQ